MAKIPGLSYSIRHSADRLQYQANVYNEEFVERLLLAMGHPDYGFVPSFGIVSPTDPSEAVAGDDSQFSMSANATNPLAVDVFPGMAVTRSGMWLKLTEPVYQLQINTTPGVVNVIYAQYVLDLLTDEVNDFKDPVSPGSVRIGGPLSNSPQSAQIDTATLDVYTTYSPEVTDNFVPLGIVTVQEVQTNPELLPGEVQSQISFDFTRNSYDFNRPWFSVQDSSHRGLVGSGVPSNSNPHGLSQNDLTVGDFSPLQLQLDHGMVVSDDKSIEKIPGVRCHVANLTPIEDTETGDNTGFASTPPAQYVELRNYPIALGRVWLTQPDETTDSSWIPSGPIEEWAARIVPGTTRVVFPYPPPVDRKISMYYTKVEACEPPTDDNEVTFGTKNPVSEEIVIAGGAAFTQLSNTQETFSDAQRFPMVYDIIVDGNGTLMKTPQVVYCRKALAEINTTDDFTIDLYGPGKLICGLTGATPGFGTPDVNELEITVNGKDADGDTYSYTFSFVGSEWSEPMPGSLPNDQITPAALRVSDKIFSEIDTLTIDNQPDLGSKAAIMIWSAQNPFDTYDQLKDACHVASLTWDGLRIVNIRDQRIISTTVRDFLSREPGSYSLKYFANVMAGGNETVYLEDFLRPRYHHQIPNSHIDDVVKSLPIMNMSKLHVGSYGYYSTRTLPVALRSDVGSLVPRGGPVWRVVLVPIDQRRVNPLDFINPTPNFHGYLPGTSTWQTLPMTPVPGMLDTYEVELDETPVMIKVDLDATELSGMLIFG